jgi:hypothetical protein
MAIQPLPKLKVPSNGYDGYNGIPPEASQLNKSEAKLWINFFCYHYGFEGLNLWKNVADMIREMHMDIIEVAGHKKVDAEMVEYWGNAHFANRSPVGNRKLLSTEAFWKDFQVTEMLLREAVTKIPTNPRAIDQATAILKRRAQMAGYDAATRVVISDDTDAGMDLSEPEKQKAIAVGQWAKDFEANLLAGAQDAEPEPSEADEAG